MKKNPKSPKNWKVEKKIKWNAKEKIKVSKLYYVLYCSNRHPVAIPLTLQ